VKYMLIHVLNEAHLGDMPPEVEPELAAWADEMVGRGVELDGARLARTSTATTVRTVDGRLEVTDGPFAETKEQIAGYDVLECDDLDQAVAVASAHPTLHVGAIEVRPFDDGMPTPEVPETVAEGKRRYLMLVCADMRRAMAAEREAARTGAGAEDEEEDTSTIDAWCESVADRRIYGFPLAYPDRAVTVRRVDGRIVTTDGPFAETKEQIAGFDLLECHDLDEALEAARTHPVASGGVLEVRPLWD